MERPGPWSEYDAVHRYLSRFVDQNKTIDQLAVYQVMRAANRVEKLLGLTAYPT